MRYNLPKPSEICMSVEQFNRFFNFIMCDDLDFYEEYTVYLTEEEQEKFFQDNPDFMLGYPVCHDRMYLLRDRAFRGILKKIKEYEGERG